MDEKRHRIVLRRFYIVYAAVALVVYGLLMAFVFPWWNASNHPVVVTMGAGSAQEVQLAFAKDEKPLRLAPLREPSGYLWHWGTELPPRARYDLALVFPQGTVGEVVLKDVEVITLSPERSSTHLDYKSIRLPENDSVRIQEIREGHRLYAEPGGRLFLDLQLPQPSPYEWFVAGAKASIGFFILALGLLLLLATFLRFPDGAQSFRRRAPAYEYLILLVFVLVGSLAHLYLVRHSVPAFTPGDSDVWLTGAIGGNSGESALAPGAVYRQFPAYPAFLAKVANYSDWDMSLVTQVQAYVFCVSMLLLSLSMIRLVQGYFLGPVVLLALMTPPVVWASRHIGTESLFCSSLLVSLAAFFFLWQRGGWKRWLGFILFGMASALSLAISRSGVILLLLPLGLVVGTAWWGYSVRGGQFWKLSVLHLTLGQVAVSLVIIFGACIGIRVFSENTEGSCRLTASLSSAPFVAGLFDVRAIEDPDDYESFLRKREAAEYRTDMSLLAEFPGIGSASVDILPWRVLLVVWGRLSGWGLFLPDIQTFDQSPLVRSYSIPNGSRPRLEVQAVNKSISELMRRTGVAVHVMDKRSNQNIVIYNKTLVVIHAWFYRILFLAALAGWLIALMQRKYLAAVLIIPYLFHILLLVLTLDVSGPPIQTLEPLLWLAVLTGILAVNPKSMQKAVDESDRRCMAPIRPKRLLTRYQG